MFEHEKMDETLYLSVLTASEGALSRAAGDGYLEFVRYLLDEHERKIMSPIDPDQVVPLVLWSPVHPDIDEALTEAAEHGHVEIVEVLLDAGANISYYHCEALRWASAHGNIQTVRLLVDRGADLSINDCQSLHWAAQDGHLDVVEFLLKRGADVSSKDNEAIYLGVKEGQLDTVKLLLKHGASLFREEGDVSLARVAADYHRPEILQFLLEQGAQLPLIIDFYPDEILKIFIDYSVHSD
jgi:ankyrin repeat protein